MKKMHVKRGDTVEVLSGKDKGKQGKIIAVQIDANKVIVEGVAMVKKHQKARVQGQESGILHMESAINASNVLRVCTKCKKGVRTGTNILDDGAKVRYCKKCGEVFND